METTPFQLLDDGDDGGFLESNHNAPVDLSQELSKFSPPLLAFAAAATILILVVGVLGNTLTIIALIKCPRVRNVAAAFIISLCVADLLFCILVLPFSSSRFIHGTWIHGDVLCTLFPFIRYGNIGVSLLSITMITINRYIMIAHHSIYARVYKPHWIVCMIVFCWFFSFGFQLPTLLGSWGWYGYDRKLGTCTINPDPKTGANAKNTLFIVAFIIPCLIIVICYALIFWVVHESEKRLRGHSGPSSGSKPAPREHREQKARRNEWRITKMVLAIFLSFVVCYLPITIIKVTDGDVHYPGFHILGYLLLYLSACINPVIYVIMNKQYRQAYRAVLTWKGRGALAALAATTSNPDKSKDIYSNTMVSQVSIALSPMNGHELPQGFEDR